MFGWLVLFLIYNISYNKLFLTWLKKGHCPEKKTYMDKIEATGFVFKPVCTRGWLLSLVNHLCKRYYDIFMKTLAQDEFAVSTILHYVFILKVTVLKVGICPPSFQLLILYTFCKGKTLLRRRELKAVLTQCKHRTSTIC